MNNKSLELRISEIEKRLNIVIPKVYKDFLADNVGLFDDGVMCLDDGVDWQEKVQVILKQTPENKAKTMMIIKKALMLDTPISELLAAADNAPCVLTDKHSAAKAKSIVTEYQLEEWLELKF